MSDEEDWGMEPSEEELKELFEEELEQALKVTGVFYRVQYLGLEIFDWTSIADSEPYSGFKDVAIEDCIAACDSLENLISQFIEPTLKETMRLYEETPDEYEIVEFEAEVCREIVDGFLVKPIKELRRFPLTPVV